MAKKDPDVKAKMAKLGVEPVLMGTPEFARFFKDDYDATVKLAKEAGIKPTD